MAGPETVVRGRSRITDHRTVARDYREIRCTYLDGHAPPRFHAEPGRFLTILPPHYPNPMIRRPFAYSDSWDEGFAFIYEIRGTATRDLADLEAGDVLDWMGPLGTGFPRPGSGERPILVSGGIGIGPIAYLARSLAEDGLCPLVVLGARDADRVPDLEWPDAAELRICTDDGSRGIRGSAPAALERRDADGGWFAACGPLPMMKAVHELAVESGRPCYVSMEEMMACGVGACQGCAVPMAAPSPEDGPAYERACVEGPVFSSRRIAW